MTTLTNIAPANHRPVYVDCSTITAVLESNGQSVIFTANGRLYELPKIEPAILSNEIKKSGHNLLALKKTDHNDATLTHYISTAAITYVTVAQPDADGMIAANFGLKDLSITVSLSQEEWLHMLSALQNNGRTLLSYDAAQAFARWSDPQQLYIYPDAITRMRGDGSPEQLHIYFGTDNDLTVQVCDHEWLDQRQQQLYWQWRNQQDETRLTNEDCIKATFAAENEAKQEIRTKRAALARQLAQANDAILVVQDNDIRGPVYVHRSEVGAIALDDPEKQNEKTAKVYSLYIASSRKNSWGMTAYFNRRAQRDAAFDNLQRQLAAPTSTPRGAKPGPK